MAHRGAAFGDFNNDGRVEIAVSVLNGPPQILMNRSKHKHLWLIISLGGKRDNRDGLGARITVTPRRRSVQSRVNCGWVQLVQRQERYTSD
jgi:hypothetical protein